MYKFQLFVASCTSSTSIKTIKRIRDLLNEYLPDNHSLSIIDIIGDPERARDEMVFATPVLIKTWPEPAETRVRFLC